MKRLLVAFLLAGCVSFPQTPDEFRQQIPNATFGEVQKTDLKRPLREVAKTFQARAPQCLDVTVRTTEGPRTYIRTLKQTVVVKPSKVELYVQQDYRGGGIIVPGKVPEGGAYYLVADVTPVDKAHSQLTVYGASVGASALFAAVTGWATGETTGCPDLTQ
jgi:starvation-inducible outer membrane lipoprotein